MSDTVSVATQASRPPRTRDEYRPKTKTDLWLCWYVLPIFFALFGIMFVPLGRVMPPPRPDVSIAQKAGFISAHSLTIQIGFGMLMVVIGFSAIAVNANVGYQMKRMTVSPAFAYAYMGGMAVGTLPGCLFAAFCLLTAALRPGRSPEIVALLYDTALLSFVGSLGCFSAAYLAFAIAILLDRNDVFPKWLAYVSVWQIVTEILAAPVFVFKSGPLAWNGSISFWMGTAIFAFWQGCVIVLVRRAIKLQPVGEPIQD